jgi:hypothetical protein
VDEKYLDELVLIFQVIRALLFVQLLHLQSGNL